MTTYIKYCIITFLFLTIYPDLSAQHTESKKSGYGSIFVLSFDSISQVIVKTINDTKSPRFNEIDIPRFLLTNRNQNIAMGIGGSIKAVGYYDFNGIVEDIKFDPSQIASPATTAVRNQFQMTAAHSSLFFKLVAITKNHGNLVVYINGKFNGKNRAYKLHDAYVDFMGWMVGLGYGKFVDHEADVPTIDNAGPCGMISYRAIQLSYTYKKIKDWQFAISAEMPKVYIDTHDGSNIANANGQRIPDFAGNIQYHWGNKNDITAAGIIRNMTYNIDIDNEWQTKSTLGWGVQLSSTFHLFKNFKCFGQVNYGKGIGRFIEDTSELYIDLVPDPKNPNKAQALPLMGWYAGLRYDITSTLFVSSTYSQSKVFSDHDWPGTHQTGFFKRGQYLVANMFWNITPNILSGIEYLRGWRTGFHHTGTRTANRVNAMLQYSF